MNCAGFDRLLIDHLEGCLPNDQSGEVLAHADACPDCGRRLIEHVEAAVDGDRFRSQRDLLRAAVLASHPQPRVQTPRRRIALAAGSVAAAITIACGLIVLRDVSGREMVLDQLRRGPADVASAIYTVRSDDEPAESRREVIYRGTELQLSTRRSGADLLSACGRHGEWNWSFDASADRLSVREPAHDSPVLPPTLVGGPLLADYLRDNFRLAYSGTIRLDGHDCWVLVGNGTTPPTGDIECYVDIARRIVRKVVRERGTASEIATLTDVNRTLDDAQMLPGAFLRASTLCDVDWHDIELSNVPVASLLERIMGGLPDLSDDPPPGLAGIVVGQIDARAAPATNELRTMLKILLPSGATPQLSLSARGVLIVPARNDLLNRNAGYPAALNRLIDPAVIADMGDLRGCIAALHEATGVVIELTGATIAELPVVGLFADMPLPAALLLNAVATSHGLSVRIDGDKVLLEAREPQPSLDK